MDHATDVVIRHGKDKKVVACSEDLHDANPEATVITVEEFDNYEEAIPTSSTRSGKTEKLQLMVLAKRWNSSILPTGRIA